MKIYSDKELKNELPSNVLFENQDYYILFEDSEITAVKRDARSSSYLDLLPFGKIARINFSNKIGFFTLLNQTFDVRSKKLGDLSGNEQASRLIDEINSLFNQLSFNYSGLTSASRQTNFNSINTDMLARFDYFRQAILSTKQPSFENCVNLIISLPHHKLKEEVTLSNFSTAKNIVLKEVFGSKTKFVKLTSTKYDDLSITKKIRAKGKAIFPNEIVTARKTISTNTQENQFVKFFLTEVSNLCFYVLSNYSTDEHIISDAKKIKKIIDSLLAHPFFRSVGNIQSIPYTSTTLLKGNGYKELFHHYIQSRYSFHHILDRINKDFSSTGLNDISYLYEVWCFIKVATIVLKGKIDVLLESQIFKGGNLSYKFIWKDSTTAVGFNISYSHSKGDSYSLTFRPDISMIIKYETKEENLILFDAKYKVIGDLSEVFNSSEENRTYNVSDIHKMHSYLDAIPKASTSFILYPGNNFVYFSKDFKRYYDSKVVLTEGVGAIPLIPGSANQELENVLTALL
jgi:predicted component of viral defense system (DUF524 family)